MDSLLDFAMGPMFRLAFAIMLLGMVRLIVLTIINGLEVKGRSIDKALPKSYVRGLTWGFIFPIRAFRVKPLYSVVSILFHIGMLLTPILLFDHSLLFQDAVGFSFLGISIPHHVANWLTILTIVMGILLFVLRLMSKTARFISRVQDFLWPLIILIPFISGYICSNSNIAPDTYKFLMFLHVMSANFIFILLPFTKIAHCVLMPLSQWITARVWKFPKGVGDDVVKALGKEGEPI